MNTNTNKYPIEHLSPSSFRLFLNNRFEFYKAYIKGVKNFKTSEAMFTWTVYHSILEMFYNQEKRDSAFFDMEEEQILSIANAIEEERENNIDKKDEKRIDRVVASVKKLLTFYQSELPDYKEILGIELLLKNTPKGITIPFKGFVDLVVKEWDEIILVDHKTVSRFSNKISPWYMIQANMYYLLYVTEYKQAPKYMYFDEIKKSKNRDGSPQLRTVKYKYNQKDMVWFARLLVWTLRQLEVFGDNQDFYLPNPFDMLNGEQSFLEYIEI